MEVGFACAENMKRILFYVHFNKTSALHSHVIYQLESLRKIYSRVVLISNSPLSSMHKRLISPFVNDIYERANFGFDFYAWKEALDREGRDALELYDSVTLMNDTCFGPLYDLGAGYDQMDKNACSFWGLTNHRKGDDVISELGISIPEHIQSFFLVFKSDVVSSAQWYSFWSKMECEEDVFKVIAKYEIQLTRVLADAGFRYEVLLDTTALDLLPNELSYVPADYCLKRRLPLLKIKALLQHKNPKYILGEISRNSQYPVALIDEYISEELQPDRSISYCDKVLNTYDPSCNERDRLESLRVAIHIHVYYLDVWEEYLNHLQHLDFRCVLYITTTTELKAREIDEALARRKAWPHELKEILVMENRGRDVLPWLSISEDLAKYDIVLHAHTKKSPTAAGWVGESWQQDIFDSMLKQAPKIISAFIANKSLGIAVPDIPFFWRYVAPIRREANTSLLDMMGDLWARMGCEKKLDLINAPVFVMPYGTMFWYRPAALQRMTSIALNFDDVPAEPLPDITVLHAIERLLVYVAWNAGYDYKIVPPIQIASGFLDAIARNQS